VIRSLLALCLACLSPLCWPQTPSADTTREETARIVVGFAQAGAPSAQPVQHMFVDFSFTTPLPVNRLALWGDIRLASLPRPINSTVLTLPADVAKAAFTTPLNQLAQSGEFVTGLEYHLAGSNSRAHSAQVSLTTAYGAAAPVAYSAGQNRFYRQYWGGFRFASARHSMDAAFGQNETITGGLLHGPVLRFSSEYGLTVAKLGTVYLMGEVQLATTRGRRHADLYRLGIGFDFLQMLKAFGSN